MLHLLAANYDWHHHITPTSEEIKVFATIFPMVSFNLFCNYWSSRISTNNGKQDDLFLSFTRREPTAAA
jgi:hypothetical protein